MPLNQDSGVAFTFGNIQKLFSNGLCLSQVRSLLREDPYAAQNAKQLRRIGKVPAQFVGASKGTANLGRGIAASVYIRNAEGYLELELARVPIGSLGQMRKEFQALSKESDCLDISTASDGAFSGLGEIAYRSL